VKKYLCTVCSEEAGKVWVCDFEEHRKFRKEVRSNE